MSFQPYTLRTLGVADLAISPDDKLLATFTGFPEIKVWRIKDRDLLQTFTFASRAFEKYRRLRGQFSAPGVLLVTAQREPITSGWEVWSCHIDTGKKDLVLASDRNQLVEALWGDRNAVAVLENPQPKKSAGVLKIIDLAGKKADHVVPCEVDYDFRGFSQDRSKAIFEIGTVEGDYKVRVVEVETGKTVSSFPVDKWGCDSYMLLADNKTLVTIPAIPEFGTRVVFWDVATGRERVTRKVATGELKLVELSPNGRILVARDRFAVYFFEVASGRLLHRWQVGRHLQYSRFSTSGKAFAIGDQEGTVKVIDAPDLDRQLEKER
jgi:WD40 repeat protein